VKKEVWQDWALLCAYTGGLKHWKEQSLFDLRKRIDILQVSIIWIAGNHRWFTFFWRAWTKLNCTKNVTRFTIESLCFCCLENQSPPFTCSLYCSMSMVRGFFLHFLESIPTSDNCQYRYDIVVLANIDAIEGMSDHTRSNIVFSRCLAFDNKDLTANEG
jgi:hypothetical protein